MLKKKLEKIIWKPRATEVADGITIRIVLDVSSVGKVDLCVVGQS